VGCGLQRKRALGSEDGDESSDLDIEERRNGPSLHMQQADQIRAYREAWKEAGHTREPRVSVSRSIFALVNDLDRMFFGRDTPSNDTIGLPDENIPTVFGRNYAAEPDVLVAQLAKDEAIEAADTLLLTVPNQLGVEYCAHVIPSILTYVAPSLGWR
jgi:alkanesulfonate monooxygenase SsuD/methylene tetrahydromethanopterin reductase-like flavin-dependent oxidoreductase (luciferase family)